MALTRDYRKSLAGEQLQHAIFEETAAFCGLAKVERDKSVQILSPPFPYPPHWLISLRHMTASAHRMRYKPT